MAEYLTNTTDLTKVADAIRAKGGTSDPLVYPDGFVTAINNIQAGSSGGGHGATVKVTNKERPGYSDKLYFCYWEFGSRPGDVSCAKEITVNKGESVMVDNVLVIGTNSTGYLEIIDIVSLQTLYLFPYSDSAEYIADPMCLTGDTLITLADKTTKRIDQM